MKTTWKAALFMGLASIPASAGAQSGPGAGHLVVRTVVQTEQAVVDEGGERIVRLVDATKVVPGDEVIYTVTFSNVSTDPAENVVITNPIPAELTYVDGSAFGPGADTVFSVDGGSTFAAATELSVIENGATRPAEPGDYTHVRWRMRNAIPAGAQGVARFRATLD